MVVDSSALIAVLTGEAEAALFIDSLSAPGRKLISSFTLLETAIVIEAKKGEGGAKALSELMAETGIDAVAFDSSQAEVALDAWRRYGKGRHQAALNIGDCVSYALSRISNEKLLFKGNDFSNTDIASVYSTPIEPPKPGC